MPCLARHSQNVWELPSTSWNAEVQTWCPSPNSSSCKDAFLGFDIPTSLQPPCPVSPHLLFTPGLPTRVPTAHPAQAYLLLPAPSPATAARPTQLLGTSWMIKPSWCRSLPPTPMPRHTPSGASEGSPAPRALGKGLSWEIRQPRATVVAGRSPARLCFIPNQTAWPAPGVINRC